MRNDKKMRVAVLSAPRKFQIEEQPIPAPSEKQVLIRVEGCGVCGSNFAPWEGRPWFVYPFEPGAPGHEGWGVVEAVGRDVKSVNSGDRVAFLSYHSFAEFDLASEDAVVRLPEQLSDHPFPGEALGCAINVFRRSNIQKGETVAIVGIGFLGALLTNLAANAGARVIAITRRAFALNIACQLGAEEMIPMLDHSKIIDEVKRLTNGAFCDCVIEAVGMEAPLNLAGEITKERGRLVIAGYHQDGSRQVNMQLWNWRGIDVINAHERDSKVYVDGIRRAVEAVEMGHLRPSILYTHTFPLDSINDSFAAMSERPNNFMKALVTI